LDFNILTYLDWRGDLTFAERAFNDVDNVILCDLAYIDFIGIIPDISAGDSASITICAAYEKMKSSGKEITVTKGKHFAEAYTAFLEKLAESERFAHIKLSNFVDIHDETRQMQFAAMCMDLEDGTNYIAFRGTDQTIVGWREDFSMSFQITQAQLEAVRYLEQVMEPDKKYRIGGHSKGGNLAVYAAMKCSDSLKDQMITIHSNDGIGLSKEILIEEKYAQIRDKIQLIVPEFCVIGMIYENGLKKKIVKSDAHGVLQHAAMSWQVKRDDFLTVDALHPDSGVIHGIITEWLEEMDMIERKILMGHFFDALSAGGAKSLFDIPKGGIGSFGSVLISLARSNKEAKAISDKSAKAVRKAIKERVQKKYFDAVRINHKTKKEE